MNFGYSRDMDYGYEADSNLDGSDHHYPRTGTLIPVDNSSPNSSRMSIPSTGSFKPLRSAPTQAGRKMISPLDGAHPAGRSSLSSLPQDQLDDGYNPYTARVRGMDPAAVDSRTSPRPQIVPNRAGSTTPTRDLDYSGDRGRYHSNTPSIGDNIQYGDVPPYPDLYTDPAVSQLPYENNLLDNSYHNPLTHPHYRDDSPLGDPSIGYAKNHRDPHYEERYNSKPPSLDNGYRGPMANDPRFLDDGTMYGGVDPLYRDSPLHHDPYAGMDLDRRHQGLPPVRMDPFADDPFRDQNRDDGFVNRSQPMPELSTFRHTPSPAVGSDRYPTNHYGDGPPSYREAEVDQNPLRNEPLANYMNEPPSGYPPRLVNAEDDEGRYYPGENSLPRNRPDYYNLETPKPLDGESDGQATPSVDGRNSPHLRKPDLQEVIDFLGSPNDAIKADSAGYLQHLCFMDDDIKAKTRALGGIPPLVALLNHEIPEVHKNACGALKNLSYGRNNDDNKKAIKNASGIPALTRLLRKSQDEEVKELVTGVLWNLSSCEELKKAIIDDCLTVLVMVVMIPHSGWGRQGTAQPQAPPGEQWTTVFRNASGVLRNVSSAGYQSRKRLRECDGLVESLIHAVKTAIGQSDIDNKPVENCVCILRNLSYRIQEVDDPEFYLKRTLQRQQKNLEKGDNTGCFGGTARKKNAQKIESKARPDQSSHRATPPKGQEILWHPDIVHIYLPLLADCSNPVTLEAAVGAIQNLAACDWQPGIDIRAAVRKEKGLAIIVELLGVESDKVVCAAATALRNLALDQRNKELVGKYAMRQLVLKLPTDNRQMDNTTDDTICAVIATLYEIIKKNPSFAHSLLGEGGVSRLVSITQSEGSYLEKTVRYSAMVLHTMWQFKELSGEYRKQGYTESDFITKTSTFRTKKMENKSGGSGVPAGKYLNTPTSTLNRPISGQGYDDSTLSPTRPLTKGNMPGNYPPRDNIDNNTGWMPKMNASENGSGMCEGSDDLQNSHERDAIPLNDLGPGYQCLDEHRVHTKPSNGRGLMYSPTQEAPKVPVNANGEPLYAQVNKSAKRNAHDRSLVTPVPDQVHLENHANTDSWV